MLHYTIPEAPITKKNSMRMVTNHKTGKMFPMPSKAFIDYQAAASYYLRPLPDKPIESPVCVTCVYYMPTRRRVDLTNLLEATHDMLVKNGVLADDNCRVIVSVDGSRVHYDKANPRTEIYIREEKSLEPW